MSFGINGPDNIPSIQKSHHTNDGGAGNLGYFMRGKKKKDEEEEKDIFEFSSEEDEEKHQDTLEEVGNRIKNFWIKFRIKNKLEEEIDKLNASEEQNNPEDN